MDAVPTPLCACAVFLIADSEPSGNLIFCLQEGRFGRSLPTRPRPRHDQFARDNLRPEYRCRRDGKAGIRAALSATRLGRARPR